MGESAVLFHSYSFAAPITRIESHEDNTIHALSQSISFGKFVTENLEWGKWSSFSHKKYVEEAKKFSRPGSVAQKKAFFEAHYKRIAEAKKSATEEQPTATPAQVLLHTLETHLNLQQDEELERQSIQIDDVVDDSLIVNGLTNELEENENSLQENGLIGDYDDKQQEEGLKEDWSLKKKERKSITIPPKSTDTMEISLSEKIRERPITQSSEKNEEKSVHRQRFSFLHCFIGNAKTQDQNQIMKKRKTEKKKKKKQFLCLSLKPKTVRESYKAQL